MKRILLASMMLIMTSVLTGCNCDKCSEDKVEIECLNNENSCDITCSDEQCNKVCPRNMSENDNE